MSYAQGTTVSVLKSRMELEAMLTKYKAPRRAVIEEPNAAVVMFEMQDRIVHFRMPLPDAEEAKKQRVRGGLAMNASQQAQWLEQRQREQWRALVLVLKAKFTALETKVETFEDCFLAHIVMPGGETVAKMVRHQLNTAYSGSNRPMLTSGL